MEFEDLHRRHMPEPDLVPILDALTCIIFFLLYSTTFIELTKLTLPSATVNVLKDHQKEPPVSPKFYVDVKKNQLELRLNWSGARPGTIKRTAPRLDFKDSETENQNFQTDSVALQDKVLEMVTEFKAKNEKETSIQLALAETTNYQELITVMDGMRKTIQDIVLMSPDEVNNKEAD